jgi:F420-non-reducing hydrogenase small subunit
MTSKPKVAICWLGACGGCDETILDLNEEIVKVVELFEIVLWPVALDFKYKDIERMQDKEIAASIINGCVRNSEHKELAHLLRQKSEIVVAFGACACFGGTPSLANLASKESIFSFVYKDSPTAVNPSGLFPKKELKENGKELTLPEFFDKVEPLNRVIDVDYYLPGCPPHPDLVVDMFNVLASGDLPPKGSTLSPPHALCAYCERNTTKPEVLRIKTLKRIHEVGLDSGDCFLAQGIICLGPATRSGCGTPCMKVNVPCRGCMGPVGGVRDPGTRYISTIASLVDAGTDESIREVLNGMGDAAGYLYRFTVGSAIL